MESSKPNGSKHDSSFFVKWIEGLELLLAERDKRYEERFEAQQRAVEAALSAQKELNNTVSASSDKAILKAEEAQKEYNARSNEFRNALDDQNKLMSQTMISRSEYTSSNKAMAEKMDSMSEKFEEKNEDLKMEITLLRESKSTVEGRQIEKKETRTQRDWSIGVFVAVILSIFALLMNLIVPFLRQIK